jgi:hypothetical protein
MPKMGGKPAANPVADPLGTMREAWAAATLGQKRAFVEEIRKNCIDKLSEACQSVGEMVSRSDQHIISDR